MKFQKHLAIAFTLLLAACQGSNDTIFGEWTPAKVNIDFDEAKSSPQIIKQLGEMEKSNQLTISSDSILTLIRQNDTLSGKVSIHAGHITLNGQIFGSINKDVITTKESTPVGTITIDYQRHP